MFPALSPDEKKGLRTPLCRTPDSDMLRFAAQLLPHVQSEPSRPASVDSFFEQQQHIYGYPTESAPALDDPAVLTDSTHFYANYNANYQPFSAEASHAWHAPPPIPQYDSVPRSLSNVPGSSNWPYSSRLDMQLPAGSIYPSPTPRMMPQSRSALTVAERFFNPHVPPPPLPQIPRENVPPSVTHHVRMSVTQKGEASLGNTRHEAAMNSEALHPSEDAASGGSRPRAVVSRASAPAEYAGSSELQSQLAEAAHIDASSLQMRTPRHYKPKPKGDSPTEALMKALQACSPNAKVSAAENVKSTAESESCTEHEVVVEQRNECSNDTEVSPRKPKVGEESSPKSDCSPNSSPQKQGTPRKMRIAARFDVPLGTSSDDSNN